MKVTTDGCLFGALIKPTDQGQILDVGTGTGLLSLMIAQKSNTRIQAIEIDNDVAEQASSNFEASPWKNQLTLHNASLQHFESSIRFEQIVCNPPFFKGNALGKSTVKNQAVHDNSLPMNVLLAKCLELLSENGSLWLMYPAYEMTQFKLLAEKAGLFPENWISIRNNSNAKPIRIVSSFSRNNGIKDISRDIIIRDTEHNYTQEFIVLLKPYYLHL
ncbi:tRNA1(Val) (adenine(37)-N6)-methyltransferase [Roseivirga sp.]|uniref:tRNA1(Val) (adenine(37)-N6)-methyltransferase n=1 Tax=Roseivirga sp. TaxID=1964215 RepID=UPI003B8BD50B